MFSAPYANKPSLVYNWFHILSFIHWNILGLSKCVQMKVQAFQAKRVTFLPLPLLGTVSATALLITLSSWRNHNSLDLCLILFWEDDSELIFLNETTICHRFSASLQDSVIVPYAKFHFCSIFDAVFANNGGCLRWLFSLLQMSHSSFKGQKWCVFLFCSTGFPAPNGGGSSVPMLAALW